MPGRTRHKRHMFNQRMVGAANDQASAASAWGCRVIPETDSSSRSMQHLLPVLAGAVTVRDFSGCTKCYRHPYSWLRQKRSFRIPPQLTSCRMKSCQAAPHIPCPGSTNSGRLASRAFVSWQQPLHWPDRQHYWACLFWPIRRSTSFRPARPFTKRRVS